MVYLDTIYILEYYLSDLPNPLILQHGNKASTMGKIMYVGVYFACFLRKKYYILKNYLTSGKEK